MRIVKGRHVQVGLITSNLWLVEYPVAMYCQIEWCISQPQSALAFRLAQLHANDWKFMSHSGGQSSLSSQDYYHTW